MLKPNARQKEVARKAKGQGTIGMAKATPLTMLRWQQTRLRIYSASKNCSNVLNI